ncbi:MAG: gliding motility protein GldM [Flavobacteriaceae bacterium]|nr:gliding motility protein GldM [Flavobacteriaceae bacterium]
MASGKLSPRQKMINLMYLVLIAMLALNMSKEVLTAFGIMNDQFVEGNKAATSKNSQFSATLAQKAADEPEQYSVINSKAKNISKTSQDFYAFLDEIKTKIKAPYMDDVVDGVLPYENMDKGDHLDEAWFNGDKLSKEGDGIIAAFATYRKEMFESLDNKNEKTGKQLNQTLIDMVNSKFSTNSVKDKEGVDKLWLDYNFKGFPSISSLAKVSAMQASIKALESEVLSSLLSGQQASALSFSNYHAFVIPEKTAFFSGENFKGRIVLGRYDSATKPNKVILNGKEVDSKNFKDGGVVLDFPAGAVGERDLKGKFIFMENGKPIEVPIQSGYAVVPKPNSATISADKMNVVYRGIPNPMTISFAGIAANKVSASASGLRKSGKGYIMTPTKGREVTINVTGTLPNGDRVSDKKKFRIKDIPRPQAAVSGVPGIAKKSKNALKNATISAMLEDFVFDLKLKVNSFKFKVPGQPTIVCQGRKLSERAKSALARAKRGDQVTIFGLKASVVGSPIKLKDASPVIVELAN